MMKIVKPESVNQLSATLLNSISEVQMWECPCTEKQHVKRLWISRVGEGENLVQGLKCPHMHKRSTWGSSSGWLTLDDVVNRAEAHTHTRMWLSMHPHSSSYPYTRILTKYVNSTRTYAHSLINIPTPLTHMQTLNMSIPLVHVHTVLLNYYSNSTHTNMQTLNISIPLTHMLTLKNSIPLTHANSKYSIPLTDMQILNIPISLTHMLTKHFNSTHTSTHWPDFIHTGQGVHDDHFTLSNSHQLRCDDEVATHLQNTVKEKQKKNMWMNEQIFKLQLHEIF